MRIILAMLLVLSLLPYAARAMSAEEPRGKIAGGPCSYAGYPGTATIVSVKEAPPSSGYSIDRYEVKFTFSPNDKINEPLVKLEGAAFTHTLPGGAYPEKTYLEKNGIKEGAVFDATLKVIRKGTCTPVLFDFPSIR